jgi:hypothetical protein
MAKDALSMNEARNALRSLRHRLKAKELEIYQQEWLRERRDRKILTRGKVSPFEDTDTTGYLVDFLPERQRIAENIAHKAPLSTSDMRMAIQDLYALCSKDYSVIYYPDEEPVNGKCRFCSISVLR